MAITNIAKPCPGCTTIVKKNGISCFTCDADFHAECAGMTVDAVICLNQLTFFNWFCNACGDKYGDVAKKAFAADNCASPAVTPSSDRFLKLEELIIDCHSKIDVLASKSDSSGFQPVVHKRKRRPNKQVVSIAKSAKPAFNRSHNLIIAGVPEPDSALSTDDQRSHDQKVLSGICETLNISRDNNASLMRLKKGDSTSPHHALIRVEFANLSIRKSLLRASAQLRQSQLFKDTYVRPDLTPNQLVSHKLLVVELKNRRNEGEDVIICSRTGTVVLRPYQPVPNHS